LAADAGTAPAVASAGQVADLAFDLGSGGAIVGFPVRVVLPGSGAGELVFVGADVDGASALGVGALRG
jgi:hypothetical protein